MQAPKSSYTMINETEQERLLEEALASVKQQSFYLRRAIESGFLRDAIKCSANIVSELRTSSLSPKSYYQLYISIFQELQYLSDFLNESLKKTNIISELYENVQHAGSIIPRLYLLITVGSTYIQSLEAPAKDILSDLTELCKGVQHPTRGLFLRYYLTQMCKDKLPDTDSIYERSGGGTVEDAFHLLFSNFVECTNLWIRLGNQSQYKDRQKERFDLRVLVGANLVCMSQLEGMTCVFYNDIAFPKLLEFIIDCQDNLAQLYLFDCLIQVFSDECHLKTLDRLLATFLIPHVDLKPIQINLIDRLKNFLIDNPSAIPEDMDVFELFHEFTLHQIDRIQNTENGPNYDISTTYQSPGMTTHIYSSTSIQNVLDLQVAFLDFTLTIFPNDLKCVNFILADTANYFTHMLSDKTNESVLLKIIELLSIPLKHLNLSVLHMESYTHLMSCLNDERKKDVVKAMVNSLLENQITIDSEVSIGQLFKFISPLLTSQKLDDEITIAANHNSVSKLISTIKGSDPYDMFNNYHIIYEIISENTHTPIKYVFPTLVFCTFKLIRQFWANETEQFELDKSTISQIKKMFLFTFKICEALCVNEFEMAMRLYLQCAILANEAEIYQNGMFHQICYEFLTQAIICFEEKISDSQKQFSAIIMIVGTMSSYINCLSTENYMNLARKITLHSSNLLKKTDRCRALLNCTHLFWNNRNMKDGKRVLECLQRCLKIADPQSSMQSSNSKDEILIEILEKYIHFYEFEDSNNEITLDFIKSLVALCAESIDFKPGSSKNKNSHFTNIWNYLEEASTTARSRYSGLNMRELEATIEDMNVE